MKTLTPLFCIFSIVLSQSSINAEALYKWTDARGNTQYGDKPPAGVNAKAFDLPKITVIDNYADQWKPLAFDQAQAVEKPAVPLQQTTNSTYSKLVFLAPKANQAIRANDGDVSAMISLKPPLKKGHQIVFAIDGKTMGKGKSRTKNFSNLQRGNHTASVKVIDANGKTVKSSSVGFNVLRANSLNKDRSNQATKSPQATTFNTARQQQIQNSN